MFWQLLSSCLLAGSLACWLAGAARLLSWLAGWMAVSWMACWLVGAAVWLVGLRAAVLEGSGCVFGLLNILICSGAFCKRVRVCDLLSKQLAFGASFRTSLRLGRACNHLSYCIIPSRRFGCQDTARRFKNRLSQGWGDVVL